MARILVYMLILGVFTRGAGVTFVCVLLAALVWGIVRLLVSWVNSDLK